MVFKDKLKQLNKLRSGCLLDIGIKKVVFRSFAQKQGC